MDILHSFVDDFSHFLHSLCAPTWEAAGVYYAFLAFLLACYYLVPGKVELGVLLEDKKTRLPYRVNGWWTFLLLLAAFYGGVALGWWRATVAYDHFWPMFTVANMHVAAVTLFLYVKGRFIEGLPGHGIFHDLFYGVELNPRILDLDFKYFSYRPLIMGWALLIANVAAKQLQLYGYISLPMAVYILFTWWYTVDYLWQEEKICTTWDVIAENLGFGLTWGNYCFFQYFYSIHVHWLLKPFAYSYLQCGFTVGFFFLGYVIFRQCNSQKDLFKRDRQRAIIWGQPAKTTTKGHLLISGWWGVARHANYLGDIMMSIGWTLPTINTFALMPWANAMFFVPFLMHREYRDEKRCAAKYGDEWKEYKRVVPARIVPLLY
jgi:delta14-sterol reductase